jgi:hypothetical protein
LIKDEIRFPILNGSKISNFKRKRKMSTFKNEFSWSISRNKVFQTCPRQYFFNYYGYWGGWEMDAPARTRQIYILKNLKNRYMWAGAKGPQLYQAHLNKSSEGHFCP